MKVFTLESQLNIYCICWESTLSFDAIHKKEVSNLKLNSKTELLRKKSELKCICKTKIYSTENLLKGHKKIIDWHMFIWHCQVISQKLSF